MKKKSKNTPRDFSKYDATDLEYYGILMKNGRARIDTKRYKKYFPLPNNKVERRQSVYYLPTKIHRCDYICNVFHMELEKINKLWVNEFSKAIKIIKTPAQVENDAHANLSMDGVLEPNEVDISARIYGMRRSSEYRLVIKSLYAQFFHQLMSDVDALCLRVLVSEGYDQEDFTKKQFDIYIQGKQGKNAVKFKDFKNYAVYDEAYCVWNFLKHNSLRAYTILKNSYPERIYNPDNSYQNGQSALSVIKLDEKYILHVLDHICDFFDEVCEKGFGENPDDAKWDYDDYFLEKANDEIDVLVNPLGLPEWI